MSPDAASSTAAQYAPQEHEFERLATDAVARFAGKHLRVRRSSVVHVVGWYRWFGQWYLPGPACGTGWAGGTVLGELHAVDRSEPVTCRKCRTTSTGEGARQPCVTATTQQLPLEFDVHARDAEPSVCTRDEQA